MIQRRISINGNVAYLERGYIDEEERSFGLKYNTVSAPILGSRPSAAPNQALSMTRAINVLKNRELLSKIR